MAEPRTWTLVRHMPSRGPWMVLGNSTTRAELESRRYEVITVQEVHPTDLAAASLCPTCNGTRRVPDKPWKPGREWMPCPTCQEHPEAEGKP